MAWTLLGILFIQTTKQETVTVLSEFVDYTTKAKLEASSNVNLSPEKSFWAKN